MTTVYIAEFSVLSPTTDGVGAVAGQPPIAEQTVAIGGGSLTSAAFSPSTAYVRVHSDSVCSIRFGQNPTALATSARFAANQTEYFGVPRGGGFKIAVITNT